MVGRSRKNRSTATGSAASKTVVLSASTSLAACCRLEAIPACKDHLSPIGACSTCRFESDASATADHNNDLPKELRFTMYGGGDSNAAHRSSVRLESSSLLRQQSEGYARPVRVVMFNTRCEIHV